jgi:hypothetical protein
MLLMGQEFEEPGWQSWETLFEPFALGRPPASSAILAHLRTASATSCPAWRTTPRSISLR